MSSPFVCCPKGTGQGFILENGTELALFPAEPEGSYVIRALLPVGAKMTFGLSNEGAASLLVLLMKEYDSGKLKDGFDIMDKAKA